MNLRQIGLAALLADFLGLTAYAVYQHGYLSFFEAIAANAVTVTLGVDLMIALGLAIVWMWRDARARGISPLPYVLMTVAVGSAGPLLYLLRTPARDVVAAGRVPGVAPAA